MMPRETTQTTSTGPSSRARGHVVRAQALAGAHEVAGEEDRQGDLGELTGLERHETERDPHVGVGVGSEARDEREEKEEQTDQARQIRVAEQHAVVAQRDHHGEASEDRNARPGELANRRRIPPFGAVGEVDAVDHREAETGQQRRDGHDERVGRQRDEPQHHVECEHQQGDRAGVDEEGAVDRPERAQLHQGDRGAVDEGGEEDQGQLAVASGLRNADLAQRPHDGGVGGDLAGLVGGRAHP